MLVAKQTTRPLPMAQHEATVAHRGQPETRQSGLQQKPAVKRQERSTMRWRLVAKRKFKSLRTSSATEVIDEINNSDLHRNGEFVA